MTLSLLWSSLFSSLTLPTSAFPSVHIVRSLTSKRPSILSIYLYLSLSISIYLYLSLSISIYLYRSLSISIDLYLSISIYLSIYPSIHLSIYLSSIHIYIYTCMQLNVWLFKHRMRGAYLPIDPIVTSDWYRRSLWLWVGSSGWLHE